MKFNSENYNKVKRLADFVSKTWDPKMKWMWGEALLGYALDELDKENGREDYTKFLRAYCDHWAKMDPAVDQSDTAAPGLITYAMYKRTEAEEYKWLTRKVLDYIRYEPRLYGDCLNHLGSSKKGRIYPKSVWIDSVMMFSVFTSLYARENNDSELLDFAARQPKQYAAMMFDEEKGLWAHSYWVNRKAAFPGRDLFWGRGNGWVICGFPMILDNIGLDHCEAEGIIDLFRRTSESLLGCMNEDYSFNTLLKYKSYRELSATALIAAGWLHGIRCGYLDKKFLEPAVCAFEACVNAMEEGDDGIYMTEISGPTIPLPLLPKLGYKAVPLGKNWSYGIAALIFAAIEYKRCLEG
ncbi:MAG: glycoside hydrolase family 88 protein [Clostridia bacterium]|nr:glycoside hydrolase family 88 protein [Clostridia bacterium]